MPLTLLLRYAPRIRFDLFEPDPPSSIAQTVGTVRRANGDVIGSFTPGFLGPRQYANGDQVKPDDYLQIERTRAAPALYGRVLRDGDITWLQWWIWNTANGFHWATDGWHFGDWTSITMRVGDQGPELLACAQHRRGEVRLYRDVRVDRGGHPIVYLDLGSHAAHYRPSLRGNGLRMVSPTVVLADDAWAMWPGRWGQSRAGGRWADSPRGPGLHREWHDPAGWVSSLQG